MVAALNRVRRRARMRVVLQAAAMGGGVFGLVLVTTGTLAAAAIGFAASFAIASVRRWSMDAVATAHLVESASSEFDNLLVTIAEIERTPRQVHPEIRQEIDRQLVERLARVDVSKVVPLLQPLVVAVMVVMGCGLLVTAHQRAPLSSSVPGGAASSEPAVKDEGIVVDVMPPAYSRRPPERFSNPLQVTVLAGSRLRVLAGEAVMREWVATEPTSLELQPRPGAAARFLSVVVIPDAPPVVRVLQPGRDTAFAQPDATVTIGIDARDDLGLQLLALRYTKASGGGENVTFSEGEVPLVVERAGDRDWTAGARWSLRDLGLGDGDVLVYRAVARDTNPAGAPVQSESFLIEIGRAAEIASAGFALPSEERKYAISQQMVIYKTQQLIERRRAATTDWLEQTRLIAMEQRMVRAEVVFLSGGEVEDEVEEAAHSHELAEGRLVNPGRAEMLRAINFMSRAEAQLNDGRAEEALVLERQALTSLERALDRRRYFLRTLPDRSRIDQGRRLTGDRREARSWLRSRADVEGAAAVGRHQRVLRSLALARRGQREADAALAADIARIDPSAPELQSAAVTLAAAQSAEERDAALRGAMTAVAAHALAALPTPIPLSVPRDSLAGHLDLPTRSPR